MIKLLSVRSLSIKLLTWATLSLLLASCAGTNDGHNAESKPFVLLEATISDIHAAFVGNKITCQKLVTRYIDRIKHYDQPSKLNSIILINPKVHITARGMDEQYLSSKALKPLHCIPVILKDNFDTGDMPTEAGSIALKGSIPPDDAFMVKKLREAGAIIIAKSNMGEWAFSPYETISSSHGETRNAYDLTRVPAGSSGGTASAIAANFGVIGMGSDTGNSIRGPASHLALVGIRSTIGATSRDGIVPLVLNRDIGGPLMRTVKDAAKVYEIITGYDPADPITQVVKGKTPIDYSKALSIDGLKGVRLGVLKQMYENETTDFAIDGLMDKAVNDLANAGAIIVDDFQIPKYDELRNATGFCSRFRFDINNYFDSLGKNAPVHSLKEVISKKLYRKESQGAMDWAMGVSIKPEEQDPPCVYVDGDPRRKQFLQAVLNAMDIEKVDAIIYPSWSNPPRELSDSESPHGNNSPIIAPHTGQPAITVPMGYVNGNLPAGLQMLGRPFSEDKLLQYAYAYEQQTKHRKPPQQFGKISP